MTRPSRKRLARGALFPAPFSVLALIAALSLAGCAAGPDFKRPAPLQVEGYLPPASAAAVTDMAPAQHIVDGMDIPGQWWTLFHSAALNDLIEQALKANPDLQAAQAALRNSREILYAGQGVFSPTVDASFQPTRQKVASGAVSSGAANGDTIYSLHTAQLSIGYVPDLFGGARRGVEALQAQAEFQRFQLEAAYLSLISNVVYAVVQEAALRDQIAATRDIIAVNTHLLEITRRQHSLGQSAAADVAAQEALLAQAQGLLPPLEKQLAQQSDALAVLTGRYPSEEPAARFDLASLSVPATLPLSLPAQLVEQRPDIRAAEENLHAASAQIGVAMANRLPNVTLSAAMGSAAYTTGQLFSAGTGFWMVGGSVTQPIFHGGTLLHQQRAAEAAYAQAEAQYRSTVLAAFRDVADTLHAIRSDGDALHAAQASERATAKSLAIAKRQLELGDISLSTLLAAQQAYLQTTLTLQQARASSLADTIALFQALGGGWWHRSDVAASL